MGNSKFLKLFKPDAKIYLWIIGILIVLLMYYNQIIGALGVLLLIYLNVFNWRSSRQRNKRWQKYIEELSSDIDSAARYAILNLPMPLTLVDFDGRITWYNSKFSDIVDERELIGAELEAIIPSIDMEEIINLHEINDVKVADRFYRVFGNIVKTDENDASRFIVMLYWIDTTGYKVLKDQYEEERSVVALLQVDNYEDVMSDTKEDKRPFLTSEIDQKVNLWASRMNALIKKYQTDKYLVLFEKRYLENLEAKRFSILDDVREIEAGNKFPMTLSIGVGVDGRNLSQAEEYAFSALELALGRGGDQSVVRKKGNFEFYGGKAKAVEKRNRVKARIIAHGLRPLIDEASNVIIMGHKFPDMDCYGSAIGIYRAVINRGKDAHIVLTGVNEAIKNIHTLFSDNPVYSFVTCEQALQKLEKDTLLVVVDTHRPNFTECPELLERIKRIVMIDHHRRGMEFIENTALKYHEPYASSTSELVTEILQYMDNKVVVEKIEAEALMAGIAVDTKNFTFKTGVRTFEAASLLRRFGADTTVVRQLFQDDLETFIAKSNIVSQAIVYDHEIAISFCEDDNPNAQLIAAQAADELLDIRGISTSFVISNNKNGLIFISGRSLGDVNVQIVLEKIGGGGHMTVAGAQLTGCTLEEAREQLQKALEEYFEEGEKS